MKNLLQEIEVLCRENEEIQRQIGMLQRAIKTPEWKIYRDILMTVKGVMAEEVFSRAYTALDADEKDAQQRAFFHINQMLEFLMNPLPWIQRRQSIREKLFNPDRTGKGTPNQRKDEKK